MNIREIRVKNFRSLRDANLSCDRLTAIVGRNGTGKSSFLRALELFYDQTATATLTTSTTRHRSGNLHCRNVFGPYARCASPVLSVRGQGYSLHHPSICRRAGQEQREVSRQPPPKQGVHSRAKRSGDAGGYGRVQGAPGGSASKIWITTFGHEGSRRPGRARRLGGSASGGVQPRPRRGSVLRFHRCCKGTSREAHHVHTHPGRP